MTRRGKWRLRVLVVVVTLAVAGGVFAYFTASGHGGGAASVSSVQNMTITAGTASTALFPAGTADVALTISNPNSFAVHVGSLSLDATQGTGGFAVDAGHSGCVLSALGFTTQTNGGAGWTVPAKVGNTNGTLNLDLGNAVSMSASAVNPCQGASFKVYVEAAA